MVRYGSTLVCNVLYVLYTAVRVRSVWVLGRRWAQNTVTFEPECARAAPTSGRSGLTYGQIWEYSSM